MASSTSAAESLSLRFTSVRMSLTFTADRLSLALTEYYTTSSESYSAMQLHYQLPRPRARTPAIGPGDPDFEWLNSHHREMTLSFARQYWESLWPMPTFHVPGLNYKIVWAADGNDTDDVNNTDEGTDSDTGSNTEAGNNTGTNNILWDADIDSGSDTDGPGLYDTDSESETDEAIDPVEERKLKRRSDDRSLRCLMTSLRLGDPVVDVYLREMTNVMRKNGFLKPKEEQSTITSATPTRATPAFKKRSDDFQALNMRFKKEGWTEERYTEELLRLRVQELLKLRIQTLQAKRDRTLQELRDLEEQALRDRELQALRAQALQVHLDQELQVFRGREREVLREQTNEASLRKVQQENRVSLLKVLNENCASLRNVQVEMAEALLKVQDQENEEALLKVQEEIEASLLKVRKENLASLRKVQVENGEALLKVQDENEASLLKVKEENRAYLHLVQRADVDDFSARRNNVGWSLLTEQEWEIEFSELMERLVQRSMTMVGQGKLEFREGTYPPHFRLVGGRGVVRNGHL